MMGLHGILCLIGATVRGSHTAPDRMPETPLRFELALGAVVAHALLCYAHLAKDLRHFSPQARQHVYLRRRCPNGLHWLLQQMAQWPEAYVRERWFLIDRLLLCARWDF